MLDVLLLFDNLVVYVIVNREILLIEKRIFGYIKV